MDDKIIVSNHSALTEKYGKAGVAKIKQAIKSLIAADAKRGIKSRLVYVDRASTMKRFKGKAVTNATSPRQNKEAIDAIFEKENPEYLMILGATDVVPHQDITNPIQPPEDDPDPVAYGDLAYACDVPYSRAAANFRGPTRVVGRLPDLRAATRPTYLLKVISNAAGYQSRKVADYGKYFALSTHSWRKATAESLFNMFGNSEALLLSPKSGPRHSAKRLAPLAHFINCHGGDGDPEFVGEKGESQPPALSSTTIAKKIKRGTVASVECCYGAQLYDSVTLAKPIPICQHYLLQGAYGFFGSTTIAYGPEEGNGSADLITQYFLLYVLEGASLGRAALMARQRFIQETSELDPVDLKTLAQFNLLGDPSVHPVKAENPTGVPKGVDADDAHRVERRERRLKLKAMGEFLRDHKPTASRKAKAAPKSASVRKALNNIATRAGIARKTFSVYDVDTPAAARATARKVKTRAMTSRYYVSVYKPRGQSRLRAAVAKQVGAHIVGYRIYLEK